MHFLNWLHIKTNNWIHFGPNLRPNYWTILVINETNLRLLKRFQERFSKLFFSSGHIHGSQVIFTYFAKSEGEDP